MQHHISHRIAHRWISYIYRGLFALGVAVALTATPTPPPASNGNQSSHNGDHGADPLVNWNS
jgi:hypothetical protein